MPILRDDRDLKDALKSCRTICVVGISPDPYKPSYFVSDVLMSRTYLSWSHHGESVPKRK